MINDTMKKCTFLKLAALAVMVFYTGFAFGQNNVIDEVVWVVGDEAILKSEVEEYKLNALSMGAKFDGDPYCVIPEELAIQKLFLHQAAIDSIEVSESEVIQQADAQMQHALSVIGSKEKLEEYFNKTTAQLREVWRDDAREGLKVKRMRQKLIGDIKVTPSDVRKYFKDLPADSLPYIPTQVEVQIVMLQPRIPIEEIDRVKARLREFTERINSGETTFSVLARMYSEDPVSGRRGGELDFMGRGQLVSEYATVAFNLQDPEKVSKIVETEYGFHIIQLIEKRGDRVNTRHILLKPVVDEKDLKDAVLRLDSIADDIRDNKFSFEEAAAVLSHDKETRNNHGIMANPETNTTKFEMQELPQEIARVVDKMNVGEISKAFPMVRQKDGKQVVAIVKLKSRVNGHKATITDDYQRMKDLVLEHRSEEMLKKWIVEKQRTTYVRINENWRNCDFKYPGWLKEDVEYQEYQEDND